MDQAILAAARSHSRHSGNEYRDEHYRRIGFANAHFGSGSVPGWKTDRGVIYIRFDPPDELESHSGGT